MCKASHIFRHLFHIHTRHVIAIISGYESCGVPYHSTLTACNEHTWISVHIHSYSQFTLLTNYSIYVSKKQGKIVFFRRICLCVSIIWNHQRFKVHYYWLDSVSYSKSVIMCPFFSSHWLYTVFLKSSIIFGNSAKSLIQFERILFTRTISCPLTTQSLPIVPLFLDPFLCVKHTLMVNTRLSHDTRNFSVSSCCSFICNSANTFVKSVPGQLVARLEGVSSSYEPVSNVQNL